MREYVMRMDTKELPSRVQLHVTTAMRQQPKLAAHFHFGAIATLAELGLLEEARDYARFHNIKVPGLV